MTPDTFQARATLPCKAGEHLYFDLNALVNAGVMSKEKLARLPFSIKVLLESALRNFDGFIVSEQDVRGLANWNAAAPNEVEIPFLLGRVVLQDFTGVPCVVDLAAMRDAMKALGGDPKSINPLVPCDLVIDHSVQVDEFGSKVALTINAKKEFERNRERYEFLKWGQQSLSNFSVVPPATGIVHQVNLEYLAKGVLTREDEQTGKPVAFPDSLVGTDSHTTMINGLGVVGWGVGGIEAEAVMLGQPVYMLTPKVVGFKLTGKLPEGSTATDLVLTVTQMLRAHGVVEKFVEFYGPGLDAMSIPDRATIANMAPEYGATMGLFPVDQVTLDFLRFTGRSEELVDLVEKYYKAQGMFRTPASPEPEFTERLELDLSTVQPSLAGPRRPQDRVLLSEMKPRWRKELVDTFGKSCGSEIVRHDSWAGEGGQSATKRVGAVNVPRSGPAESKEKGCSVVEMDGRSFTLHHGDVVIAAITSCTNTSNPDVMIAAGLVARKARALGLTRKPWVKTSLAPGSKVVTAYFDKGGLSEDLDALGFHTVGYGCTTCIGNSGPLPTPIEEGVKRNDLVVASVLSGNRNFEGRINPYIKANYLASPPLVVAYAIAGTVDIDVANEPLAVGKDGKPVFLKDIWPTHAEVQAVKAQCMSPEQYRSQYAKVFDGNPEWNAVPISRSDLYEWNDRSTYIQQPPYFEGMSDTPPALRPIEGARCLAFLGDSVTTDHISPAGDIAVDSPAGKYLQDQGVPVSMFNSYGSRRGNDRVMTRGTFGNIRIKNRLAAGDDGKIKEGWWTRDFSQKGGQPRTGLVCPIYDAAMRYRAEDTPLVVLAGKDYGMGSSRDWAAKGTNLLGVRAVISESFERIHRSNLVGMGVLPLNFMPGQTALSLGLDGSETFDIELPEKIEPRQVIRIVATRTLGEHKGKRVEFETRCRVDTPVEAEYFRHGGILHFVLRRILNEAGQPA
ncbi:MAG: aconitate hydratase AcnA [Phycisphaerales bacterium]|nr:aconitate hydratase AcnA [Phycisphaerales bacterium]